MVALPHSRSLWNRLFGPSVPSSTDPREFQQHRVALYLKFQLVLLGSFYVLDVTMACLERGTQAAGDPGLLIHLGLVVFFLVGWLLTRTGERSSNLLSAIDIGATLGICLAAASMLATFDAQAVEAGPAFAVAFAIVARAAIIPSSGKRTLGIGLAAAVITTYGYWNRGPKGQPGADFVFLWTLAFGVASAAVSRVIYGLQEQVQKARELGQYVLEDKLGEGGMGVVYRAHHAMLRRDTAIKLLLPERTGVESLARFEREVRLTARLTHPNTVTIFDYGRTPDGTFYYAMELLDGADLDDIVAIGGPLPAGRVVHVLACVAGALAEAHDVGLIHRDIKPANIILCRQGGVFDVPKVVDFGLVKELAGGGDALQTKTNSILGTPLYMSPESIKTPDEIDGRSDLYALGAVGYYLLTGEHVFPGETVVEVCMKHLESPPIPPSERLGSAVAAPVERLVLACLAKNASDRPQTALELLAQLRHADMPRWDDQNAKEWWSTHAQALRSRRATSEPVHGSDRTLAVDPARRS
jgi:serine/threonine-protein kinase